MLQARSGHGSPEKPRLRAKPHAAKRIAVRRKRKKPTSSPAWYYHTINGEKRQEFCPKNWQESKFLSSRHKFSQKNRRKTAKKHPAPTKTPPKTSLKMFHMKLSRNLRCFTWNYKQSMRRACFYQKYIPCSTSMFHMKHLLRLHRVRTRCFIAAGTNLIHDRRFHPYILLLCTYLSFAQLVCNIAKRRRTAARALMCIFRGKAVWYLAPFMYVVRLAST